MQDASHTQEVVVSASVGSVHSRANAASTQRAHTCDGDHHAGRGILAHTLWSDQRMAARDRRKGVSGAPRPEPASAV
jgi:hypothetical protein